ncbi:hypothetical protein SAMN04487843_101342 [Methylobacterium sp. ap11]|uniref:hypothetical protein n=1 Tax=Methylobacterium sp. ap11 TaxID=1761799 RepID=UPI0008D3CC0E|nr:hypothetical protein [Methylobacterium sp. ap11]SEO42408.1 hypothetical protein SAMN04487843_101342 [Methylobacterium sp. ap11]
MPLIDNDEWAAIAAHLASLETQVADLTAQVDFLSRERLLYRKGREALEGATAPTVDLLVPLPAGYGRGNADQLIALTYGAAREMAPGFFQPSPVKRSRKPDGTL